MGFRGKIHHGVRMFLIKEFVDPLPVADIKFYKAELRVIHHILQRGQVTRVCEAVHTDDPVLRMFLQHIKDKIGSDKTGAAGHNDIHQVFPPCI